MQHKQLPRKNRLQKAFFYAKVTTAVAAGAWLSFQPLASPAQATKAPQQKVASAPAQKPAIKGKTISFSDAQKQASATSAAQQKCNAVKVGGKQPPLPKYDSTHPYAGVRRILIELVSKPIRAQEIATQYVSIVDSLAARQARIQVTTLSARQSAVAKWQILQSTLNMIQDDVELWKAVNDSSWDCDASGFAQRDASLKNNEKAYLVLVSTPSTGHVVTVVGGFAFDTRGRISGLGLQCVYSSDSIPVVYSSAFPGVSAADSLQTYSYLSFAINYTNLCRNDKNPWAFDQAVLYYHRSLQLFPENAIAAANLGILYFEHGFYPEAVKLFTRALQSAPNDLLVYDYLCQAHAKLRDMKSAKKELDSLKK